MKKTSTGGLDVSPAEVTEEYQQLDLTHIDASSTNPRKTFDEDYLEELAASIRLHGVLQPIMVRKSPKLTGLLGGALHYELVCGECRWRASKLAGRKKIPAVIRELSDLQVLEIQVVENLQRKDLDPIEEAAGFQVLLDKHGYTIEEVAQKTGKSKATIYGSMKLLNLGKKARKAIQAGTISRSVAELIGRIPSEKDRESATSFALGDEWNGSASFRRVKEHIERNFMVELKGAAFDREDKNLVPEQGACSSCPFRTGNMHGLYPGRTDVCTKPECYKEKCKRHGEIQLAKAEAENRKVLSATENAKVFKYGNEYPAYDAPYKTLDESVWVGGKSKTVREVLNGQASQAVIGVTPMGQTVELVPRSVVEKLIGHKSTVSKHGGADAFKEKVARELSKRVVPPVVAKVESAAAAIVGGPAFKSLLVAITAGVIDEVWSETKRTVQSRREVARLDEVTGGMTTAQLLGLIAELVTTRKAVEMRSPYHTFNKEEADWFKVLGVDVKALRAKIETELKAEAKAKKEAKAPKGKKSKSKRKEPALAK